MFTGKIYPFILTKFEHAFTEYEMFHNIPKMINIYTFLASKYNFSRCSTARILYRLANPLSSPGSAEDVDLTFHTLPNGDLNATPRRHLRANTNSWIYSTKVYQMENLAHKPFCTTGKLTNAFFSCNLEDKVFIFSCLDRSKEIVRNGQRLYCDGPYEIIFAVYEYPPGQMVQRREGPSEKLSAVV